MSLTPYFSIITSIHEFTPFFEGMIFSLNRQTFKNFELVLILDSPSEQDLPNIMNTMAKLDPAINCTVHQNSERLGLTKSLNIALSKANGQVFVRIDCDDEMMDERLETLKQHYDEGCLFVGNGTEVVAAGVAKSVYPRYSLSRSEARRLCLTLKRVIAHSAFSFHRRLLDKVGYYDEKYRYSQDFDMLLRCTKKLNDDEFRIIPALLTRINLHSQTISSSTKKHEQVLLQICRMILFNLEDETALSLEDVKTKVKQHHEWNHLTTSNEWRRQLRNLRNRDILFKLLLNPGKVLILLTYRKRVLKVVEEVTSSLKASLA